MSPEEPTLQIAVIGTGEMGTEYVRSIQPRLAASNWSSSVMSTPREPTSRLESQDSSLMRRAALDCVEMTRPTADGVAGPNGPPGPVELSKVFDDVIDDGPRPRTRTVLVVFDVIPAPDVVARAFGVENGTPVRHIQRLRYTDDEPLALLHNYLPADLLAIKPDDLIAGGLYALLRSLGIIPKIAHLRIGARAATATEARVLDERPAAPLLTVRRTAYDGVGRAIEHASYVYRPSLCSFTIA